MKRKYSYIIVVMLSIAILFNCKNDPVSPEDIEPSINKINPTADVLTRKVGDTIDFVAKGSDADGDDISFKGILDGSEVPLDVNEDVASYFMNIVKRGNYILEMIVQNSKSDTTKWQINVENSEPTISNLILLPNNPTFQDTAKVAFETYDADGDSLTEFIEWYVNNNLVQSEGKTFPLEGLNLGDVLKATIKVYDGSAYGNKTSNTINLPKDTDGDGIWDRNDSCPNDYNTGEDYDGDGIDDACDPPPPLWELTLGGYDDFDGMGGEQTYDGSQLAVAGVLSTQLWNRYEGEDVSVLPLSDIGDYIVSEGAHPSGNIIRLLNSDPGYMHLEIISPEKINFDDFGSLSADVMLKDTNLAEIGVGLDFHTSIPEQPPGISWYSNIGIRKDPAGSTYIVAHINNKNTSYQYWNNMAPAETNTWYNLRMDMVKLSETQLEIRFYINGELKATEIPPDSEILLDPSRLLFGPIRNLGVFSPNQTAETPAIAYLDNFKAVYKNRVE